MINTENPLQNKQVAVLGAGSSGLAAAKLCRQKGAQVMLMDNNAHSLGHSEQEELMDQGIKVQLGEHDPRQMTGVEMIVLSPGIALHQVKHLMPQRDEPRLCSELETALAFVKEPVVAVTGTNGKTTTAEILARMLRHSGYKVFLGGNIGVPLSEYVLGDEKADLLVLEVSSFQLMHTFSLRPRVGILLNFAANHLDYHQSLEEYWEAKVSLFRNQTREDLAILPMELKSELELRPDIPGRHQYFQAGCELKSEQLPGVHNAKNLQAAYLACRELELEQDLMQQSLQGYSPGMHRLQVVGEKEDVMFVDDSKATTVHALQAALESFARPVLLLAGGRFKSGDPAALRDLIKNRVRLVAAYGESRETFKQAWAGCADIVSEADLQQALHRLTQNARPGDVILLSPAASSFDQFQSYEHRGRAFQELVQEYLQREAHGRQTKQADQERADS